MSEGKISRRELLRLTESAKFTIRDLRKEVVELKRKNELLKNIAHAFNDELCVEDEIVHKATVVALIAAKEGGAI